MMTSTYISLAIIGLIVVFWFYMLIKLTFLRVWKSAKADNSIERGQPIDGKIIAFESRPIRKYQRIRMTVEFPNFAQTPITEEFHFVDSRPEESRYGLGKRVRLLLNPDAKSGSAVSIAGGKTVIGKPFVIISLLFVAGYLYGAYRLYQYCDTKLGSDWTRADELFANNESMPLMGIIFFGVLIFQFFVFKIIMNSFKSKKKISDFELKYHGIKTNANILKYEDTNVTINDNPMVKFHYTFQDKYGTTHTSDDKVVVGKLEIGLLPTLKEKEIMYLPQSPHLSKFVESLKPSVMAGCSNGIFLFIAFVFSVVLMSIFIEAL